LHIETSYQIYCVSYSLGLSSLHQLHRVYYHVYQLNQPTNQPNPWIEALHKTLLVTQLVKKVPSPFLEP